jgi:hypothetical protein
VRPGSADWPCTGSSALDCCPLGSGAATWFDQGAFIRDLVHARQLKRRFHAAALHTGSQFRGVLLGATSFSAGPAGVESYVAVHREFESSAFTR